MEDAHEKSCRQRTEKKITCGDASGKQVKDVRGGQIVDILICSILN